MKCMQNGPRLFKRKYLLSATDTDKTIIYQTFLRTLNISFSKNAYNFWAKPKCSSIIILYMRARPIYLYAYICTRMWARKLLYTRKLKYTRFVSSV